MALVTLLDLAKVGFGHLSVQQNILLGAQSDKRGKNVSEEDEFQLGIKICLFRKNKKGVSAKVTGLYAEEYLFYWCCC